MDPNTQTETKITCPNCKHSFSAEQVITSGIEKRVKNQLLIEFQAKEKALEDYRNQINKKEEEFEAKRKQQNRIFLEKLQQEKIKQRAELLKQMASDYEIKIQALERENVEKKDKLLTLQKREVELLQQQRAFQEKQEGLEVEIQKRLFEEGETIKEQVKKTEEERMALKVREYEKQLDDQKKLIEEMRRKSEQGSMQLQGEAQELILEEMLRSKFPFDQIGEVSKGVRGADVVQTVINPLQQKCGTIIYESKRTKAFSDGWIEKLKIDLRNQNADIAVVVTQTMPKDMPKFGLRDGVWICTFEEIHGLAFVLREMILKTHAASAAQENKGGKMESLYAFLTSNQFRGQVEGIVEGFTYMKTELDREKRAMRKIWMAREKQIEKVIDNTIDMYGAIKGIAGSAVPDLPALELGDDEDEFVDNS